MAGRCLGARWCRLGGGGTGKGGETRQAGEGGWDIGSGGRGGVRRGADEE